MTGSDCSDKAQPRWETGICEREFGMSKLKRIHGILVGALMVSVTMLASTSLAQTGVYAPSQRSCAEEGSVAQWILGSGPYRSQSCNKNSHMYGQHGGQRYTTSHYPQQPYSQQYGSHPTYAQPQYVDQQYSDQQYSDWQDGDSYEANSQQSDSSNIDVAQQHQDHSSRMDYQHTPNVAGAVGMTATVVPDMIGDNSFSGLRTLSVNFLPEPISDPNRSVSAQMPTPISSLTYLNMAENYNGEVQNRIYFDYRHFHNIGGYSITDTYQGNEYIARNYNMDRFTIGFEKTLGRWASIEFRLPIVRQMGTELGGSLSNISEPEYDSEIGNISLIFKRVLYRTSKLSYTAGFGLNLPTAPDSDYYLADGSNYSMEARLENNACRLLPYFSVQWRPSDRVFGHLLAQFDFRLNRNEITMRSAYIDNGGSIHYNRSTTGKISDPSMLRLNASIGRWFHVNERAEFLNRMGAVFEFHYSVNLNSMKDQSISQELGSALFNCMYSADKKHAHVINLVAGLPMQLGKTTVTPAISVPITDARYFSTEFSLQVNRRF